MLPGKFFFPAGTLRGSSAKALKQERRCERWIVVTSIFQPSPATRHEERVAAMDELQAKQAANTHTHTNMAVGQNPVPLVNIKIGGKWIQNGIAIGYAPKRKTSFELPADAVAGLRFKQLAQEAGGDDASGLVLRGGCRRLAVELFVGVFRATPTTLQSTFRAYF